MKRHLLVALAFGAATLLPAMAQDKPATSAPAQQGMMQGGMMGGGMMGRGMMGGAMMGRNIVSVTVTALDAKTGVVEATSGSTSLKLQFAPASLATVKVGDKLSVHMAFRKL